MTRVVLLNDYPMAVAEQRVDAGNYPAQHLWGMAELRDEFDWIIPSVTYASVARRYPRLERLFWKVIPLAGDVFQELYTVGISLRDKDLAIYAADQQSAALIGFLKRLGILRQRFVMVAHNGPKHRWARLWMSGADHIITLDSQTAQSIRASMKRDPSSVHVLPWGPSLDSAVYAALEQPSALTLDFVCAGRSNRYYDGVREAARTARLTGKIFTGNTIEYFHDGTVEVTEDACEYPTVLAALNVSRCSLIPLDDPARLSGLTEATDALALGVPILVSNSPKFPYLGSQHPCHIIDERDPQSIVDAIGQLPRTREPAAGASEFNMSLYAAALRYLLKTVKAADN